MLELVATERDVYIEHLPTPAETTTSRIVSRRQSAGLAAGPAIVVAGAYFRRGARTFRHPA
jgi:hypothetical protein